MTISILRPAILAAACIACAALPAAAADVQTIELTLKDHKFSPETIEVPANERFQIKLTNADATPDEFDSTDLRVEKVVGGGQTGIIRIQPLVPGRYMFMGEYHAATARGIVVAK
ncbi:cupredoxin domain-containing protein [Jiella endophytica]|uniref:Cupredoxin domain-containing protein n=1 Tax=Jiella endophytica TaxID=2558362 RepID=A0A4Y8RRM5_9HYPH|nr:cupredoxin domain-containing protein [Jiella endophytica]TFF20668.1 cupredoxin domain-containing protein [Jiella endophytica]TFF26969.1 cupredoxin domain-containing protein [Jiella endophytica]